MRTALVLLVLLVSTSVAPPALAQTQKADRPLLVTVFPPEGNLTTRFVFDSSLRCCLAGATLLTNGQFDSSTAGWSTSGTRPNRAMIAHDALNRTASMTFIPPVPATLLALAQDVRLTSAPSYRVSFNIWASGGPHNWSVLVREAGFAPPSNDSSLVQWDTVFRGTASDQRQEIELNWTPRFSTSRNATLMLRVFAPQDASGRVHWDDVGLHPLEAVTWTAPSASALTASGAQASATFSAPGTHRVRAELTSLNGSRLAADVSLNVTNDVPRVSVQAPEEALLGDLVPFNAAGSIDPDAPSFLQNGDFVNTLDPWRTFTSTNATVKAVQRQGRNAAEFAPEVGRNGSILIYQLVPVSNGAPYMLSAEYAEEGVGRHTWILRERTNDTVVDSEFTPPLAGPAFRTISHQWAPQLANASRVEVLFRWTWTATSPASAWLTNISVRPGLNISWDFQEGNATESTGSLSAAHRFQRPGSINVLAVAQDWLGARTSVRVPISIREAALDPSIVVKDVVRAREAVSLGSEVWLRSPNLLLSPTFADSRPWTYNTSQRPGTTSSAANGAITFSIPSGPPNASVFISQRVIVEPNRTYEFSLDAMSPIGSTVELTLRSNRATDPPGPGPETTIALNGTGTWETGKVLWRPPGPDFTVMRAIARVRGLPGEAVSLGFSDPELTTISRPANLSYQWSVDGVGQSMNATMTHVFEEEGFARIDLSTTSTRGARGETTKQILVLPRDVGIGSRLDGAVIVTVELGPAMSPSFRLEGAPADALELERRGSQYALRLDDARLPGSWKLLVDVEGNAFTLASNEDVKPAVGAIQLSTAPSEAGKMVTATVEVTDPQITTAELLILRDGRVVRSYPMTPVNGTYQADFRVALTDSWGTMQVAASFEGPAGASTVRSAVFAPVLAGNVDIRNAGVLSLFGVVGLVCLAAALRRWGRVR